MSRSLAAKTADERWTEFLDSIEQGINEAMLLVDGKILEHPNSWSAPSDLPVESLSWQPYPCQRRNDE